MIFAKQTIQLDETTINITSSSLRSALVLSPADRRWIDFLTQTITDSWDERNPSRPKTLGYMGSEEFIRLQFEEYLLALLSSVKYHIYLSERPSNSPPITSIEGDPSVDFNSDWIHAWRQTSAFTLFNAHTSAHLFDIVEPRHPTAGNLSLEDIQRRLALQIQTLHLDDRLAQSKETLNKHLATGQEKVSTAFTKLWTDIEAMREAQRKRAGAAAATRQGSSNGVSPPISEAGSDISSTPRHHRTGPDISAAQASVTAAGHKAGAYISSWGSWAAERRRGWGKGAGTSAATGANSLGKAREKGVGGTGAAEGKKEVRRKKSVREEKGGDGIGRLDA